MKQHYKLVILSNVDQRSFAASNAKLDVHFDAIYTAQDIGSYKPADANFDYMLHNLETLGYVKADILHAAESMFHDHQPANRHGLANCWIYRRHDKEGFGATMNPGEMPSYDFQFARRKSNLPKVERLTAAVAARSACAEVWRQHMPETQPERFEC